MVELHKKEIWDWKQKESEWVKTENLLSGTKKIIDEMGAKIIQQVAVIKALEHDNEVYKKEIEKLLAEKNKMRVRDLQQFLSTFTASNKAGTRQGNAVSDAVLYVEVNGKLHEIKKMEVQENSQTIFGLNKNHQSHRLVLKTAEASNIILPGNLRTPGA